jgi:hypothetical protein
MLKASAGASDAQGRAQGPNQARVQALHPGRGVLISVDLCLRCMRDSSSRQAFSRIDVCYELSRPLNGCYPYDIGRGS